MELLGIVKGVLILFGSVYFMYRFPINEVIDVGAENYYPDLNRFSQSRIFMSTPIK